MKRPERGLTMLPSGNLRRRILKLYEKMQDLVFGRGKGVEKVTESESWKGEEEKGEKGGADGGGLNARTCEVCMCVWAKLGTWPGVRKIYGII